MPSSEIPDMNMSPARVLELPVELFVEILKLLDSPELLLCTLVCRSFYDVIRRSLELQYRIELAADGMIDGPPGPLTTADRMQLLLDRRRRWRVLDWTQKVEIPVPGACQAYELVGGVFAKSMSVGILPGSRHMISTWLPTRSNAGHTVVTEDLGVATRDFAIDTSRDLLVLVDADEMQGPALRVKVHLRTIGKNTPHPRATQRELVAEIPFHIGSSFIQIVDDVVGMFFWVHGPGLIIWNWITGEEVVHCVAFEMPDSAWDFSFLSNRAFMITSTAGTGSIELYSFSGSAPARPAAPLPPVHIASLHLPALRLGQELHHFSTHSGPFVSKPIPGKPFETARESRVHCMSIDYGERGPKYHLFMRNRFLLSFFATDLGSSPAPKALKTTDLLWREWGPANTRMMLHSVQFQWLRYVHGERVVLPPLLSGWPATPTICVLDFNIHPKRMNDPVPYPLYRHDSQGKCRLLFEPTTLAAGMVFEEDVTTSLPYSLSLRTGTFNYSGYMLDDERLIGMKSMALADGDMTDIDVYTF